ncbi:hypothetical protein GH714_026554 [Hevea brasiliensis]|uniref:Histone acetyl transferase HAT1 N-terminal domain-containing protein n=1 Tax=Hevea brasiliensis TaxID=3981 RepID=A0A6A6LV66_HEVBR|nr:hypothetical protein GH714_026554 [Hevea brasiliensis]
MSACSGHSLRKVEVKNAWPSVDGLNPLPVLTISSKEQVGASESYCIDPVDLNGFFDEDGKIYGYHGLKITIWISSITFHAYADIIYQSRSDGAKGITDLKSSLQILILPPYQHKGYGCRLVEVVNNVAISEDVYDLTVEEPLHYFQHVRTCVDVQRLLVFNPIQDAINSAVSNLKQGKLSKKTHVPRFMPPSTAIEDVRKTLKINRKQFLQCWEVLIYLGLDPADKGMEDFVTIISNRVKADILGKDSGTGGKQVIEVPSDYNPEMSFVMFRSGNVEDGSLQMDENQTNQKEQLQQLVDERVKEIKLIAQKLRPV